MVNVYELLPPYDPMEVSVAPKNAKKALSSPTEYIVVKSNFKINPDEFCIGEDAYNTF